MDLQYTSRSSSSIERDRRVAAAVALVEQAASSGGRVSVRAAARAYGLPKSTVHRYVQAHRGVDSPRKKTKKTGKAPPPPKKCGIPFLLTDSVHPNGGESKDKVQMQKCSSEASRSKGGDKQRSKPKSHAH